MGTGVLVKEIQISAVLTNAQILLIQKQLNRILECEGGEIEKSWDTITLVIKIKNCIPWSCWCVDCLHKLEVLKELMTKMITHNSKVLEKKSFDNFKFRLEFPAGEK